jgi:acyl-CoA synthetase (AMP-forming)/AMP-acid ligase II
MNSDKKLDSLAEYVGSTAVNHPDRLALASELQQYTYRELADRVRRLASFLIQQGVAPGDRIAVLTTPRADSYALFLAVNAVGAIWLGINPRYTEPEVLYVVNDAQPKLLFFIRGFKDQDFRPIVQAVKRQCTFIESLYCLDDDDVLAEPLERGLSRTAQVAGRYEDILVGDDRAGFPAMLVYTSGSTGQPKGALLTNGAMVRRSLTQHTQWPVSDFPRVYNPYPMNHIGSMHWVASYAIVGEGTIHFREKFDADEVPGLVKTHGINILEFFPTMYKMMLESASFDSAKFDGIEWHIFSGAQMPMELLRILDGMAGQIGTSFGMTETTGSVTYARQGTDLQTLAVTIGRPVPDGEVRVFNNVEDRECREGEVGEIQVRREYCTPGYFNRPDANAASFTQDGWFKSGDQAEVMAEGNLRFVGRLSEMYKSGGFNVYPREVELAIEAHPSVLQAAVISVPHALFGEVGYAVVSLKPGSTTNCAEIQDWCRQRLSDYKRPKQVEIRSALPLLPVGKVDKVFLRRELLRRAVASA